MKLGPKYKSLFKTTKALLGVADKPQIHNGEQWCDTTPDIVWDTEVDDWVLELKLDCGTTVKLTQLDMEGFSAMFGAFIEVAEGK